MDYIIDGTPHSITTNDMEVTLTGLIPGNVYDINVTSVFNEEPSVATSTTGAPRKLVHVNYKEIIS